ncbi:CaiB/BaiF CoA-transferase family protein [Paraburkholderia dipogonis]|uniref:CaiB/BaiF CoA-transferase family protein n=1 Tax=Paraburkholderia dipogonis TaxID=1211383 RepID=A0ABW9B4D2_9BURK
MNALQGIRVLDVSRLLPAALCTQLLGDLGADVLKIEEPIRGDYQREFEPMGVGDSGTFLLCNRNKRSMTLDLKTGQGKALLLELAASADVLVEGFRPGVMERLGLGFETLAAINPLLVYCSLSGFGQTGPYKLAPGHDLNYMALLGTLPLFGRPDTGPLVPGLLISDIGGGSMMALYAILAALLARHTTGNGQWLDVSMFDGTAMFLAYHAAETLFANAEPRGGIYRNTGGNACYNTYECADGQWLALGIIEAKFWEPFCGLIDREDWCMDQWPQGDAAFAQIDALRTIFKSRPRAAWLELLAPADVPASPIHSMREAFDDPHFRARELLQHIDHPVEGSVPQFGFPVKFSDTPASMRLAPPTLGQHTDEVLRELGRSEPEIAALHAEKIV